ncbi:rhizobactin siderophore biosynthesis protein RhbC [Halobacillus sp. BAB-2008]|nr:rhizobactin siderophore biosynthesis protein RhbC [Halobacillus sp. BAB-2008]
MMKAKETAEQATMQSFLNCYVRETENYERISGGEERIRIPLTRQKMVIDVPLQYWSLTGRHLFRFPAVYYTEGMEDAHTLDYVTMTTLLVKEWLIGNGQEWAEDELILRVLLSCRKMKEYIEARWEDRHQLSREDFDYIEAEQSLLFGHLLHPTPKSKQGLTDAEDRTYAPEHKGIFQLDYFSADPDIVAQDSSLDRPASVLIQEEAQREGAAEFLKKEIGGGRVLLPMHPLQSASLLKRKDVQRLLESGALTYLGPAGAFYTATSSFRTVYNSSSPWMFKFSVPVKITNSLRCNQPKELDRGVEVSRLLATDLGTRLQQAFPDFDIIKDPASIRLKDVPGFDVILRENPFVEKQASGVSPVAALVQDHAYGDRSRIAGIIHSLAEKEGRSTEAVSLDWFEKYLSISFDPMMWMYSTYGIALEAHQQNAVVRLENGYPSRFYYRDNQGYYFSESKADLLKALLPSLNETSDTICADDVAEERMRYYFFFNHLFGLINGFGTGGLIEEEVLMEMLRERLQLHPESPVAKSLLTEGKLPCKANLLTRLYDMDELEGPMEAQSVYTNIDNPIAVKEGTIHGV